MLRFILSVVIVLILSAVVLAEDKKPVKKKESLADATMRAQIKWENERLQRKVTVSTMDAVVNGIIKCFSKPKRR